MAKEEVINPSKLRHPVEIFLTIISVLLTVATLGAISYFCVKGATDEEAVKNLMQILEADSNVVEWLIKFGSWSVLIVIVYLVIHLIYIDKVFIGKSSIDSTRLTSSKHKELNKILVQYCEKLNIKNIPLAYIENNDINSSLFGVKVRSENALSIKSKYLMDAERNNDYSYISYLLARRVSHIYLGHNSIWLIIFTFVGRFIPIYSNLYERTMCYSTDKIVEFLIGKEETLKEIFDTYYDSKFYDSDADFKKIVEDKIKAENASENFGRFLENLLSDDPLPSYRLEAIITDKNGRLF